jgi:organic radical activating enzyme
VNNYYCSQKFWWLTVEPERRQIQSCCSAYPHKIDLAWLKNNPGQLFNMPILQQERQDMLNEVPVSSCKKSCWIPEKEGKTSRRIYMKSYNKTHVDLDSIPESLSINLGSDCNLTCVYCTRQYSTAWLRDIVDNGPYLNEQRYEISPNDRILLNLGQKKINASEAYDVIIKEFSKYSDCKNVYITGGEPLLNNNLVSLAKNLKQKIVIHTGLGVDSNRLEKIISELSDNVKFIVSAENINQHYEFARYKNSFERFERNLALIKTKHKVAFSSVISNLTIFNFADFENYYQDEEIILSFCNDPDYLSVNVLDEESKSMLQLMHFKTDEMLIKKSLMQSYTNDQKNNLTKFLKEFIHRRNLDINIFPKHFVDWLNTSQ